MNAETLRQQLRYLNREIEMMADHIDRVENVLGLCNSVWDRFKKTQGVPEPIFFYTVARTTLPVLIEQRDRLQYDLSLKLIVQ